MLHARADYNHIQDPSGKIPEDEPVFLLRGQDPLGHKMVRYWARILEAMQGDPEMVRMAMEQADKMEQWHMLHGKQLPDLPKIPKDGN